MKTVVSTDREDIENLIMSCDICYLGMADLDGTPYVLPMNFGYADGVVYLHSAQEGRKIEILERNPKVCLTFCHGNRLVYQHPDVACSYSMSARSVVACGTVVFEEEDEQKIECLNIFMKHYFDQTFKFNPPAVRNVKVWKVALDPSTWAIKVKEFGVSPKRYSPDTPT